MQLERFGTLTLPNANVTDELGNTDAATDFIITPLGGYDYQDDTIPAQDLPAHIVKRATVYETTPAALQTELDALRALRGRRLKLWARMFDDSVRWLWARLRGVEHNRTNRNFRWQDIALAWDVANQHWRGHDHTQWTLDSGEVFDDGLYLDDDGYEFTLTAGGSTNCVVTNGGNRRVTDAVLTITAGSAAITIVTVTTTNDVTWTYTGNVAIGAALVIDCGAQSVTDGGTADYAGFQLNTLHSQEEWLPLEPGATTLVVTLAGGGTGSTLVVELIDGWA